MEFFWQFGLEYYLWLAYIFFLKIGIIEFSQFCIKAYLGAQAYCKNFACFLKIPQLGIGKR